MDKTKAPHADIVTIQTAHPDAGGRYTIWIRAH